MPFFNYQQLNPGDEVQLFKLSNFNSDSPGDTLYFSNSSGVVFDSVSYIPLDCEIEGLGRNSDGSSAQPRFTITDNDINGKGLITDLILLYDNMEGATVEYGTILKMYLDSETTANRAGYELQDILYVLQVPKMVPTQQIEFTLTTSLGLVESVTIGRRASPRCTYVFRKEGCNYAGTKMFDVYGNRTIDPKKVGCGKGISDCRRYFGAGSALPFGGEAGLSFLSS